jgi:hypothetical protein
MTFLRQTFAALVAGAFWFGTASADDRISVAASGETLTGTNGGGGAQASWVHNFSPDAIGGIGGDYQAIANAHWAFGSVTGAYLWGEPGRRWSAYGEGHLGSGWNGTRNFDYRDGSLGIAIPVAPKLTLQLEDRQIAIDIARGNMPKAQLSYVFTPMVQGSVSHAHSVSGNLGTRISTARLDLYPRKLHFIAGGAFGTVDPVVLNLVGANQAPAQDLGEGFVGIGHTSPRFEWLLLGDYQRLSSNLATTERFTLTLSCSVFLNGPARPATR